ncbi:hypothetical protein SRIMM317S_03078 [Streptomyces rimosus subsp. rimosus]
MPATPPARPGSAAGPLALGDGKGFLAHRVSDGSLHIYTAVKSGPEWRESIDFAAAATESAKAAVLAHFTGGNAGCGSWSPTPTGSWYRGPSTPCRWATAGIVPPASPCSAMPPI